MRSYGLLRSKNVDLAREGMVTSNNYIRIVRLEAILNLGMATIKHALVAALTFLLLSLSITAAPAALAATPVTVGSKAVVTNTDGDTVRIRSGAGTVNEQVAEAHEGDVVTVLAGPNKDSSGKLWFKVQAPGGSGWVAAVFLSGQTGTSVSQPAKPVSTTPKLSGYARVDNTDGDTLRVRSGSSSDAAVIATLDPGATVAVKAGPVKDRDGTPWYQVSLQGATGWVMGRYLVQAAKPVAETEVKPVSKPAAKLSGFARIANTDGDNLRVRSEANRNSKVLVTLAPESIVAVKAGPVTDEEGVAWYRISGAGTTGWAMARYLAPSQAPSDLVEPAVRVLQPAVQPKPTAQPQAKPVVKAAAPAPVSAPASAAPSNKGDLITDNAMKYVGYRYRFGGTSPSGFDCSGFIYYVMNKSGVQVGRNMESQLKSGPRVSRGDLQPGDLVFFVNTYKRGLSHAGIYIGNGRFVHAENESTGVMVSSIGSSYYATRYYAAVRPR